MFKWVKLDKMGYRVPQPLRTMCYARNMSDRKLNNHCVNLMPINVKLISNFQTFVPQYILKCMYICICGRNNGSSE